MSSTHSRLDRLLRCTPLGKRRVDLAIIEQLLAALDNPHHRLRVIHVGGSNGKGSVCVKVARSLEGAGKRVGLFISPHLVDFSERITINQQPISHQEIEERLGYLFSLSTEASFFELTTALGLWYFADSQLDWAVIEVGLGGRLDATNLVTPEVSAITSISLEHTAILGDSREAIAAEKGGIIKPEVPLVLGPDALGLGLEEQARELGCPVTCVLPKGQEGYWIENQRVAAHILERIAAPAFGLKAELPARFSVDHGPPTVILDVAHNVDAFVRLFERIRRDFADRPVRCVAGFSQGRDLKGVIDYLNRQVSSLHLIETSHPRVCSVKELPFAAHSGSIEQVLPLAKASAAQQGEILLVTGSCYIMADAARILGWALSAGSATGDDTQSIDRQVAD